MDEYDVTKSECCFFYEDGKNSLLLRTYENENGVLFTTVTDVKNKESFIMAHSARKDDFAHTEELQEAIFTEIRENQKIYLDILKDIDKTVLNFRIRMSLICFILLFIILIIIGGFVYGIYDAIVNGNRGILWCYCLFSLLLSFYGFFKAIGEMRKK